MAKKFVEIREARESNGWHMLPVQEKGGERYFYMEKDGNVVLFWKEAVSE